MKEYKKELGKYYLDISKNIINFGIIAPVVMYFTQNIISLWGVILVVPISLYVVSKTTQIAKEQFKEFDKLEKGEKNGNTN
ncbi:hypothetical protein AVBRAN12654_03100 [Campylobacter sp. RM12654]|uniref:hypothetical protein n=1 Tax=unclassified Campylobacter TaxID=2593542 RepID=UPI001EFB7427|nr:hypothetical protein [Campylobacter sp. RM12651]MBZ7977766.1 hypothetical protein [Campylobacter sp. RM12654]ULO03823.1 hypothetical protein AVBRAN_1369 [Campylobacter sp. RM12651]